MSEDRVQIIWPEALKIWMERQGWAFRSSDGDTFFAKRSTPLFAAETSRAMELTAMDTQLPSSHTYFTELAKKLGTPHAEMVGHLCELTHELMQKACSERGMSAPKITLKISKEEFAMKIAEDMAVKVRQIRGFSAKVHDRIVAGFVDGMAGRTIPHPSMGDEVPGVRPAFDRDYERGYDVGEGFARALTVFDAEEGEE
jgi:hypothetical protein